MCARGHPGTRAGAPSTPSALYFHSTDILNLLAGFNIHDVQVEYRESVYRRSVGPALLRSVSNLNSTIDVRGPLTPALGVPIATSERPDAQGTMAFYFAEGATATKS